MKINQRRKAISQSMDLFMIIAAVLGVGGVVTASVYGLVSSSSTTTAIQITQASATGAASPSTTIPAFSITIKNVGSSTISCSASVTCTVTLQGTTGAASATCGTLGGAASSGPAPAWAGTCAASNLVVFTTTSLSLASGASVSLSAVNIGSAALMTGYVTGNQYTINVVLEASTASIKLTAQ